VLGRRSLIAACVAWPVWLLCFDNCFTMGYVTPPLRKFALSVVALTVPLILWQLGSLWTRLLAVVIAFITWPLLAFLCCAE